jgi:hypothetical protein
MSGTRSGCTEAGVEHFPLHELRHTAGYGDSIAPPRDLKRTQMFMRHKSITTTAVPYMHLDGHTSREVMKLATSAGKSSRQRKRRTKCRLSRGLEAPSGLEPLYEALQASA